MFACPIWFHGMFGRENAMQVFGIAFIGVFWGKVVNNKWTCNWATFVMTETMGEAAWTAISFGKDFLSCMFASLPDSLRPQTAFLISQQTQLSLSTTLSSLHWSIVSCGTTSRRNFMCWQSFRWVLRCTLLMSGVMNFASGVETTLLNRIFAVVRPAVSVAVSPR